VELRSEARRNAGRTVRLGYCLNLHPSESLDDVRAAIDGTVVPLAEHLGAARPFGVGAYLGAAPARALAGDAEALRSFAAFLAERDVAPFTYNAFPYGGFQADGLKARVYEPDWTTDARLEYTRDVARVAAALASEAGRTAPISISTHPGAYGAAVEDRSTLRRVGQQFGRAVGELARIEEERGVRVVLSIEAEPDASARNTRAAAESIVLAQLAGGRILQDERGLSPDDAAALMRRHLGTCLDTCHSAVEFEDAAAAVETAASIAPLGKLQYSSALALRSPGADASQAAREALLAMDEPRFLHQVTGRGAGGFAHLADLPELRERVEAGDAAWLDLDEWRCHFHVPVQLERFRAASGAELATTRGHAEEVLAAALDRDDTWLDGELHVEIETYTWSVLPGADGAALVEGLAAEYEHVLGRLAASGWTPAR